VTGDVATREVHPASLLLPEMSAEQFADLVSDIRAHGLRHPIIVARDGCILDGRHRWKACQEAGVTPRTTTFHGTEAEKVALIVSENIRRRHMSKGQRAMAVAMTYPEPEKGGRGEKSQINSELSSGFSARYVNQARTVLREDPESAKAVLAGEVSLCEAYREVVAADDEPGEDLADELPDDEREQPDDVVFAAINRALPPREQWGKAARARRHLAAQSSPAPPSPPPDPGLIHASTALQWALSAHGRR
jgi:ParB-like nuclease domain